MSFWINFFGVLGILTTVVIYQQKDNQKLLIWKLTADLFWVAHYLLLGANSAAVVTIVALLRSAILLCQGHKWAQSKAWLWVFLFSSLLLSILAWKDWTSLLTTVASLLCIVAYWIGNPKLTRIVSIPTGLMFLVNVAMNKSFWASLCEFFILISAITGLIRLDIHKKPKEPSPLPTK
ncbi:MAG: YgjV family protein [Eubacteriales bacterium]|nr:YgjV family protein [Eubacteriales bacterium]